MTVDDAREAPPAHLRWVGADLLPAEVRQQLLGPGAPFELRTEVVLGAEIEVFAQRPRSLRAMLQVAVDADPTVPFMVSGDRTWTIAEAATEIDAIARHLVEGRGIVAGDRVAIVAANAPEYGLVMWAVLSIGAIVTSLNGWWTSDELAYGIELTKPVLIAGDERRLERLAAPGPWSAIPTVLLEELVAEALAAATPPSGSADRPWGDLPTGPVDEDDPAVILFTSGTTGRPKGATLSHRNIINFARSSQLSMALGAMFAPAPADPTGARPQSASILSSPMFHVSGMVGILMSGPALGTKLVFPPPGRWDETAHLQLTEAHGVTVWSGVPTQFWRLLRHDELDRYDLSSLTRIGSGGAPFPPELVRSIVELLPDVAVGNGFGMSETAGYGTIVTGPIMEFAPTSVGTSQAGGEVQIRDEAGRVVREGEVGEIHLRSASVFLGYWDDPTATAACLDADRWYRTGDFGQIRDGMLHLESRMRDLILRGGENIYPIEIEHRLIEHPDIEDAAVVGVDHELLGQEVKAFIVTRRGADLSADEVRRFVGERLAAFKVPATVEFRDALPYTDTGKVLKHLLERDGA